MRLKFSSEIVNFKRDLFFNLWALREVIKTQGNSQQKEAPRKDKYQGQEGQGSNHPKTLECEGVPETLLILYWAELRGGNAPKGKPREDAFLETMFGDSPKAVSVVVTP